MLGDDGDRAHHALVVVGDAIEVVHADVAEVERRRIGQVEAERFTERVPDDPGAIVLARLDVGEISVQQQSASWDRVLVADRDGVWVARQIGELDPAAHLDDRARRRMQARSTNAGTSGHTAADFRYTRTRGQGFLVSP